MNIRIAAGACVCASLLVDTAHARPFCTVEVFHNHPTGLVQPGETIRVKTMVSWIDPEIQFAGMEGGLLATPNIGVASNRFSEFTSGALVNLGQFSGGSLVGVDIAVTPAFFTGGFVVPPSGNWFGIEVVSFDWKAPEAGFAGGVAFDWTPDPNSPNVRFFPVTGGSPLPKPPTQYIGTSITVVPAPAAPALVAMLALAAARRRRR